MVREIRRERGHSLALLRTMLGASLVASGLLLTAAASAEEAVIPLLSVSGEGIVRSVPDQAQISAGVVTQAPTAGAAMAANGRAMNAVFAAIRKLGVPEKSIQTSGFSVTPQYPPYRQNAAPEESRKIIGYEVQNQVTVILDDVSKVGSALDALVQSGSNQMGQVSFTIRDPKPLLMEARALAVEDARARAQTYAKAAGVSLGRIISIQESGAQQPRPMMMEKVMMASARMADAPTPTAAGEQAVTAHVSISWEVK